MNRKRLLITEDDRRHILRDDPLYGDIRNRMNQFYEGFNAIYKNKEGEITPNGVRRSDGSLNVTTLLNRIKGLKQWEFRR